MAKVKPVVLVAGSLNMDLVIRCATIPLPGQTLPGSDFVTVPGGKGANQAAAAARLGRTTRTVMIGRVGDDAFGVQMRAAVVKAGVDDALIMTTPRTASGVATITVAASGENAIVIGPGANGKLTTADVRKLRRQIAGSAVVVVQLEVPLATVVEVLAIARQAGVRTIVDPAPIPAAALPAELYQVDVFSPNQTEAQQLTGVEVKDENSAQRAADILLDRGAKCVVLKLGAQGAFLAQPGAVSGERDYLLIPGYQVKAVDTTAAGDSFTGALAVALAEGQEITAAIALANAAGALACTVVGAQTSIPSRAACVKLMKKGKRAVTK
ncbi:MAG: ribokinase [Phycisphaerae bacterium]